MSVKTAFDSFLTTRAARASTSAEVKAAHAALYDAYGAACVAEDDAIAVGGRTLTASETRFQRARLSVIGAAKLSHVTVKP